MLDIKWIRENPELLDNALAARNAAPRAAFLLKLDEKRRAHIAVLQDMQTRRNMVSKEIGQVMGAGKAAQADVLKTEMAELKTALAQAEEENRRLNEACEAALAELPNIPADNVPAGKDESDNVEIRRFGEPPRFNFAPKEHFELGEALGQMDFARAAKLSGARFTVLSGALARLERFRFFHK